VLPTWTPPQPPKPPPIRDRQAPPSRRRRRFGRRRTTDLWHRTESVARRYTQEKPCSAAPHAKKTHSDASDFARITCLNDLIYNALWRAKKSGLFHAGRGDMGPSCPITKRSHRGPFDPMGASRRAESYEKPERAELAGRGNDTTQ